jgi:hypothetical protein
MQDKGDEHRIEILFIWEGQLCPLLIENDIRIVMTTV